MGCADNQHCEDLYANKLKLKHKYHPKVAELDKKRRKLLKSLTQSDLTWTDFPLRNDPSQVIKNAPYRIEVCNPVSKDGLFLPISADEQFCLAKQWDIFPLTAAVMDQVVFGSNYVPAQFQPTTSYHNFNFEKYSEYLNGTTYGYGGVCVGAHKVWLISGKGQRINHGFHIKKSGTYNPKRYYGNGWTQIQNEGAFHEHDVCFWDYSQLIQFMRNLKTKDGTKLDLKKEIRNKNPAVWYPSPPNPSPNDPQRFP